MAKFIFNVEEYNEAFKKVDEFKEWITADNRLEAWASINKVYPSSKGFDVTLLEIE